MKEVKMGFGAIPRYSPYIKYAESRINSYLNTPIPDEKINDMLLQISIHCKNDLQVINFCKEKIEYYKKILVFNKLIMNKNMIDGRKENLSVDEHETLDDQMKNLYSIEIEAALNAAYWTMLMNQKNGNNK